MSEPRADCLVQPVYTDIGGNIVLRHFSLGVVEQSKEVPVASEKTWEKVRKNLQEVAKAYLKEVEDVG